MTPLEFEKIQKNGLASFLQNQLIKSQPATTDSKLDGDFNFAPFLAVLNSIHLPKRHLTSAPSFTPKNFLEQIQFYDDGIDRRVYFYLNGSWSYITLT